MWISRKQYNVMLEHIKSLEKENLELLNGCYKRELEIDQLEELIRSKKVEKIITKSKATTKKIKKESK